MRRRLPRPNHGAAPHPASSYRPTWFDIDLDAAVENLAVTRRLIGPNRKLFAVIKGGGYGFGTTEMAETFAANGADALALADVDDAIRLRARGIRHPILLYPNCLPEAASAVVASGITPTLLDEESARAYSAAAKRPTSVFVKIDVGLARLGVPVESAVDFARRIAELPRLHLEGVYTHLHAPPGVAAPYVEWQVSRFSRVVAALEAENIKPAIQMVASSIAVLRFPQTHLNAVDPGRMLYGFCPADISDVRLRSVFRGLKTRLIAWKPLAPRDEFVDQVPFPAEGVSRVGVIPIGWGDGVDRLNAGKVLIRGKSVPMLGRPSFEHTRIDLTSVPEAQLGDEVVLIGEQHGVEITLGEVAQHQEVDAIQLAPAVGERVARVYYFQGQVAEAATRRASPR